MAISEQARGVIERPLDKSRIKSRDGGKGMTFDYIGTEHAIQLLNEAFDYAWDSRVLNHEIHDTLATVLVELKVWDDSGNPIVKQQFGSCNINRGVDIGAALKGASSDGLKKCASQIGVALELYLDDVSTSGFKAPSRPAAATDAPKKTPPTGAAPRPATRPASASPSAAAERPNTPTRPPTSRPNSASVQKPTHSTAPTAQRPPTTQCAVSGANRPNPFAVNDSDKGINTHQLSALTSLSSKKGVNQPDLISLVPDIADAFGVPKQTFEELTHAEAIQVIKAAQLK